MRNHIKLKDYDLFIGRCLECCNWDEFEYENDYFAALEPNGSQLILKSLDDVLKCLCYNVRSGKKILLNKSPGIIEEGCLYRKIKQFEPLSDEELLELEQKYELILDLKLERNPFLYQPESINVK